MAPPNPPPRELWYLPLASVLDDATFRLRTPGDVSSLAQSIAQAGQLFPIEVRRVGEGFQLLTGFRRVQALHLLHRDRVLARVHEGLSDDAAAMLAAADTLDTEPLGRDELVALREKYRGLGWSTPALEELLARAIDRAERVVEELRASLLGEAAPDRSVPDEDSIPDDVADGRRSVPAVAPSEPPEPAPLGRPHESLTPAGTPDDPAVIAARAALADAARDVAAIEADLAEAEAEADRLAPPGVIVTPAPAPEPAAPEAGEELTADQLADDLARRLSEISVDLASLVDAWNDVPPELRGIIADQLKYYSQLGEYLASVEDPKP